MLDTVLDYAAQGRLVFPLTPKDKIPLAESNGHKGATGNPSVLRRYWGQGHPYNIGIRTGVASGVWVLDLDGEAGFLNIAKLEVEHGPLPPTLTSFTSNGCHLWFKATTELPCSIGKIGKGIDVKADGGYVVAPPSVHPDGPTYRWGNTLPPAEAPQWLVRLVHRREAAQPSTAPAAFLSPSTRRRCGDLDAWGQAALDRETAALARTAPGGRNHALNLVTFRLFQIVAGGRLDAAEVVPRLIDATIANGLMKDVGPGTNGGPLKIKKTIRSGSAAGLRYPRGPANV